MTAKLAELLFAILVVAAFYVTGVIPFNAVHVAFQFAAWSGGVAFLRYLQERQA